MPHHRLLSTPIMRLAEPGDATTICAMPSAGRWRHVKEASSALRAAALGLGSDQAEAREMRVLVFEIDREIVAASALRRAMEPELAQLITLILHREMRGCRLREAPRQPLCAVALDATMRFAARSGYRRMATHIAHADNKGLRLAQLAGFSRVGHADREHGVWAVSLR
ncbi:MAG TPA: hypothetical protein VGP17_10105 [Solirubrobacteraceae bacterium]|jgi:hypothetical protein|nr:hypothetical protein [Solirubrobacteraceae bacterium]